MEFGSVDEKEIKKLIKQDIEMRFYDLGYTYAKMKITEIDGKKPDRFLVAYFYDDLCYVSIDKKPEGYQGKFVLYAIDSDNDTEFWYEREVFNDEYEQGNIIDIYEAIEEGIKEYEEE